MSNFEERLLSALKQEITTRTAEEHMVITAPNRRGSRRRIMGLAAAVTGVAAATTVALTLYGGAATPAFAVEKSPDGSVEVQVNEFRDSAGLKAELAKAGITAVVDYLPKDQTCKSPRGEHSAPEGKLTINVSTNEQGISFRIEEGQIAADQTLVLAFSVDQDAPGEPPVASSIEMVKGPVAPCEAVPMQLPPPGKGTEGKGGKSNDSTEGGADEGPSLTEKLDD
ncbi:hypothetical protein [Streptosporangium sp. KLBMP 9127]|nr:hypothetical protein [Streptosporangium sp. KLBMP 9127]